MGDIVDFDYPNLPKTTTEEKLHATSLFLCEETDFDHENNQNSVSLASLLMQNNSNETSNTKQPVFLLGNPVPTSWQKDISWQLTADGSYTGVGLLPFCLNGATMITKVYDKKFWQRHFQLVYKQFPRQEIQPDDYKNIILQDSQWYLGELPLITIHEHKILFRHQYLAQINDELTAILNPANELLPAPTEPIPAVFKENGISVPPNASVVWTKRKTTGIPDDLVGYVEINSAKYLVIPLSIWQKNGWVTQNGMEVERNEYHNIVKINNEFYLIEYSRTENNSATYTPLLKMQDYLDNITKTVRQNNFKRKDHIEVAAFEFCNEEPHNFTDDSLVYAYLGTAVPESLYPEIISTRKNAKPTSGGWIFREKDGKIYKSFVVPHRIFMLETRLVYQDSDPIQYVDLHDCLTINLNTQPMLCNNAKVVRKDKYTKNIKIWTIEDSYEVIAFDLPEVIPDKISPTTVVYAYLGLPVPEELLKKLPSETIKKRKYLFQSTDNLVKRCAIGNYRSYIKDSRLVYQNRTLRSYVKQADCFRVDFTTIPHWTLDGEPVCTKHEYRYYVKSKKQEQANARTEDDDFTVCAIETLDPQTLSEEEKTSCMRVIAFTLPEDQTITPKTSDIVYAYLGSRIPDDFKNKIEFSRVKGKEVNTGYLYGRTPYDLVKCKVTYRDRFFYSRLVYANREPTTVVPYDLCLTINLDKKPWLIDNEEVVTYSAYVSRIRKAEKKRGANANDNETGGVKKKKKLIQKPTVVEASFNLPGVEENLFAMALSALYPQPETLAPYNSVLASSDRDPFESREDHIEGMNTNVASTNTFRPVSPGFLQQLNAYKQTLQKEQTNRHQFVNTPTLFRNSRQQAVILNEIDQLTSQLNSNNHSNTQLPTNSNANTGPTDLTPDQLEDPFSKPSF